MNNTDRFVGLLLGASAITAILPAAVHAQETGENTSPATDATAIVVTGSRLRGTAPVGSAVTALGRDQIAASGAVTVDRIIKEIPQVFDLGVSESSRGQSGGNGNITFGNSVNLRGIGPYATLVLVDGHRAISNSRSIDPSILPSLGVDRIEVIADGASAIYGSDAIAGVVNLIPRRSLDGGEVLARYGISDDGDFDEWQAGAALGKVWDGGQIMVAYEHVYRSNLSGDDRDFFTSDQREFGGNDYRVNRCAPGTIVAGGVSYAIPAAGVTPATAGLLVPGTRNLCDDIVGQDLFPTQEYDTVNGTGTLAIGDRVELFFDGFWSRREFTRRSAASSATLTVPQTNAFFVRPAGFAGSSYTLAYKFIDDVHSDDAFGSAKSWEITPGARVQLFGDWQFEALYTHGENKDVSDQHFGINNAALATALASGDPTTAFDPYGLGRTSPATLALISNQIFYAPTLNRFDGYEARLTGTLFELPGGAVKLAAGYEGQEIEVDLGIARGNPDTPLTYRNFSRRVDSAYGELLIPLFGPGNATAGLQRLVVDAAVRYDHYDDVGSTTNPKVGVDWSPVDGLTLRGSYGTSFRAPLISQIYGNSNALFGQSYQNPAGGAPLQGFALSAPNLDLGPETATTWSFGFEYTPTSSLRIGATYWNVEYKNQVETYLA
ncbi:MAG TPA: TonB-dependent receptor, partial [Croceibacterium sp.]|nr:TonB-dependent receptor [Croceibacterium sp.]